jgi:hypothetical protein
VKVRLGHEVAAGSFVDVDVYSTNSKSLMRRLALHVGKCNATLQDVEFMDFVETADERYLKLAELVDDAFPCRMQIPTIVAVVGIKQHEPGCFGGQELLIVGIGD